MPTTWTCSLVLATVMVTKVRIFSGKYLILKNNNRKTRREKPGTCQTSKWQFKMDTNVDVTINNDIGCEERRRVSASDARRGRRSTSSNVETQQFLSNSIWFDGKWTFRVWTISRIRSNASRSAQISHFRWNESQLVNSIFGIFHWNGKKIKEFY